MAVMLLALTFQAKRELTQTLGVGWDLVGELQSPQVCLSCVVDVYVLPWIWS